MGGKGSGGHNKKSLQEHLRLGTYRPARHGPLPEKLLARMHGKKHGRSLGIKNVTVAEQVPAKGSLRVGRTQTRKQGLSVPAKAAQGSTALPIPEWFDEHAKAAFTRVYQILVDQGTLQDVNHATLEGYCSAYSTAVKATDFINKNGFTIDIVITDKEGNPIGLTENKKRPEVDIAFKAWGQVKMFAVEMGITSSNGKPVGPKEKKTGLQQLFDEIEAPFKNV